MSNKVFFPLPCDNPNVRITCNFGEPYPQDARINSSENAYINFVINYFKYLKTRQADFTNNNIFPNLALYAANLTTYIGRVNFLKYLQSGAYQSSLDSNLKHSLNLFRKTIFSDSKGVRGYTKRISFHPGVDITITNSATTVGKQVYAVTEGVVRRKISSWCGSSDCGQALIISHKIPNNNSTFFALYGHISSSLREGAKVSPGQVIGIIPNISAFPPHLHFEISLKYTYDRYLAYPYKQFSLSLVLLGAFLFDPNSSSSNPRIDSSSSFVEVPYSTYRGMIVTDNWTIQDTETVNLSAFFKTNTFVDPIEYLQEWCKQKLFSGTNEQYCLQYNYIDTRCSGDLCVSLRKV